MPVTGPQHFLLTSDPCCAIRNPKIQIGKPATESVFTFSSHAAATLNRSLDNARGLTMTAESEEGAMVCRGATKKQVGGEERGVRHAHCYGSLPSARKLLKSRQRSSARTIESSVERLNGCRATMICRTQEAVGQMDGRTVKNLLARIAASVSFLWPKSPWCRSMSTNSIRINCELCADCGLRTR